jgi:YfiH family protein
VPSFQVLFTDRHGGVGSPPFDTANLSGAVGDDPETVEANRAALARRLGIARDRLVLMEQVHGNAVARIEAPPTADRVAGVDALVSTAPGLGLVALAADCVPVVLADPAAGVVAVAHAGRRGVASGLVPATLAVMAGAGANVHEVQAWLGPAACGRCYEVPADLQHEVAAAVPDARSTTHAGTPALDLRAGIAGQLRQAGAATPPVVDPRCTLEDATLFSHRRDGGRTGRQAGVVVLRPVRA